MILPRVQLFEVNDADWAPPIVRETIIVSSLGGGFTYFYGVPPRRAAPHHAVS
jgi:hypothetical protein